MDPSFIRLFVQEILTEAGLDDLPQEFKSDYVHKLSYELRRRIGIHAVNALDQKSFDEFQNLIKDNPTQDLFNVIDFFKEKLVNFNDLVAHTLYEFRLEILSHANELKASFYASKDRA